jgi:hypothetical protein
MSFECADRQLFFDSDYEIGCGSFGTVYSASFLRTSTPELAVKRIIFDNSRVDTLSIREAKY